MSRGQPRHALLAGKNDLETLRARLSEKARQFPQRPGVYLLKDASGAVIYVGKAKSLRARAATYFQKQAKEDVRIADWIDRVADVDYVECASEVDAMLVEARLIKDLQPRFNRQLRDDKTFPYLMITLREDFPRVEITRQPRTTGTKLYGPFTSVRALRGAVQLLQRIFKFRTCSLDIDENDPRWRWFRPCLLASIEQCTAPCNLRISKEEYRRDIRRLMMVLDGRKAELVEQMREEMLAASRALDFEKAARLRDEIALLDALDRRGDPSKHVQPEVFHVDPQKGLTGLRKILGLSQPPRTIEGIDIAHLAGNQTVASLVQFIDGLPFKPGYRRYRLRNVEGINDFQSMFEVVGRRYRRLEEEGTVFPDLLLIDGGKGQLNAALEAFRQQQLEPPMVVALAKRNEELYLPGRAEPLRLSRHSFALRLLQYVRDEAHRFAQHYHHLLRRKSILAEEPSQAPTKKPQKRDEPPASS
ncbi:MAG: UvrABC system protein C [Pirellulaceae bacterium]|nr:MAG: UvrABC system protein C [Pirellulaceae bacterium]